MAENILILVLVSIGCLAMAITPWILVYDSYKEKQIGIGTIVCAGLCLWEVCALIDFIFNSKSVLDLNN